MPKESRYSDEFKQNARAVVLACEGNVSEAARQLDMPMETLRAWVRDDPQYIELERKHGAAIEDDILRLTRQNVRRAAQLQADFIEAQSKLEHARDAPTALRALTEVVDKGSAKILALTGRPQEPREQDDLGDLLRQMAARGYLKLNVDLGPDVIEGSAEELPAGPDPP